MITNNGTIIKINTFNTDGDGFVQIISKNNIKAINFNVVEDGTDRQFEFTYTLSGKDVSFQFCIDCPLLWNIHCANLYSYTLQIVNDNNIENVRGTFAFRCIKSSGHDVLLNGKPVFIRGYIRGAKAHEHDNDCKLSPSEFYAKNICQAKKFGFNFVRFHSVIPSDEFFNEADRLGIMVHIELRLPTDSYNNLEEMVGSKTDLITNEFIVNTINRLYNHPSLCVYCIGNELKCTNLADRIEEIGDLIKNTDSSRLFIDTCAWGKINRKNIDIDVQHMGYYFPFDSHNQMYNDAKSVHTIATSGIELKDGENPFKVPLIAHEVCHYTALRDFKTLKSKFNKYKVSEPWWIDEELKMIEAKGYSDLYDDMYKASKYFQLQCFKVAIENIRQSPILSGFHFLQFADTDVYENSNGIVDCFDDYSYITPENFNVFNSDVVLLSSLKEKIFTSGDESVVKISVSNFGEKIYKDASLVVSISNKDKEYFSKVIKGIDIDKFGLSQLCKIQVKTPQIVGSDKLKILVYLKADGKDIATNSWDIWVYEKKKSLTYKEFTSFDQNNVVITDDIDKAINELKKKRRVCLVYRSDWTRHVANKSMNSPKFAFNATWNRFKPVIWDRGTNFGGLCNDNLLDKYGFTTDKIYDFNYSRITEDCDKIILDTFPVKPVSIISGIDKNVRDRFDVSKSYFNLSELQYDRTLRNFSYMFEMTVDGIPLLVCGLNLTGLDKNEPSSLCMANFIISYLNSNDFNPTVDISSDTLVEYMKSCAKEPVKERMMTQFWELDDSPVESKEYWKEAREYLEK